MKKYSRRIKNGKVLVDTGMSFEWIKVIEKSEIYNSDLHYYGTDFGGSDLKDVDIYFNYVTEEYFGVTEY